jgi:hypothetical protein
MPRYLSAAAVLVLAALPVPAFAQTNSVASTAAPPPTHVQRSVFHTISTQLAALAFEPKSALYDWTAYKPYHGGYLVCGTVNAKRSGGGGYGDPWFFAGIGHPDGTAEAILLTNGNPVTFATGAPVTVAAAALLEMACT